MKIQWKRQKGKKIIPGDGEQGTQEGKTHSRAEQNWEGDPGGPLHKPWGLSSMVAWGETSAPVFCLLSAQISTVPQLFVSTPNSFLGGANALPAEGDERKWVFQGSSLPRMWPRIWK